MKSDKKVKRTVRVIGQVGGHDCVDFRKRGENCLKPQGSTGWQRAGGTGQSLLRSGTYEGPCRTLDAPCACLRGLSGAMLHVRSLASCSGLHSWEPVRHSHVPRVKHKERMHTRASLWDLEATVKGIPWGLFRRSQPQPPAWATKSRTHLCIDFPSFSASLPWVPQSFPRGSPPK